MKMELWKSESENSTTSTDLYNKEEGENMNKNALVSKMKLHGDNQSDLAEYIGISVQRFNAKINETDGAEFTQGEIAKMIVKYNLTAEELYEIFFASLVS